MNIYLIGYRCCGKTTLGHALADQIAWPFVDMDDRIVAENGTSIAEIVRDKGWPAFRVAEREVLRQLARTQNQVVGTGGGVVLDSDNVSVMRSSGKVIWLRSRPETIGHRMTLDPRTGAMRPALTDQGVMAEIETVLAQREPLYRTAADITVDTDDLDIGRWCAQMAERLLGRM